MCYNVSEGFAVLLPITKIAFFVLVGMLAAVTALFYQFEGLLIMAACLLATWNVITARG